MPLPPFNVILPSEVEREITNPERIKFSYHPVHYSYLRKSGPHERVLVPTYPNVARPPRQTRPTRTAVKCHLDRLGPQIGLWTEYKAPSVALGGKKDIPKSVDDLAAMTRPPTRLWPPPSSRIFTAPRRRRIPQPIQVQEYSSLPASPPPLRYLPTESGTRSLPDIYRVDQVMDPLPPDRVAIRAEAARIGLGKWLYDGGKGDKRLEPEHFKSRLIAPWTTEDDFRVKPSAIFTRLKWEASTARKVAELAEEMALQVKIHGDILIENAEDEEEEEDEEDEEDDVSSTIALDMKTETTVTVSQTEESPEMIPLPARRKAPLHAQARPHDKRTHKKRMLGHGKKVKLHKPVNFVSHKKVAMMKHKK